MQEVLIERHGEDCLCDWCRSELRPIGKSYAHEEVVFVPAKLYKKVTYVRSYECPQCKSDGEDWIVKAQAPKLPLSHSLASPSILAQLLHQKIEMSLPFYRQEAEWKAMGLEIPRRTQANWLISVTENWLQPIWKLLKDKLKAESFLHADETYYRVFSSEKDKTYYWLFRTIEACEYPIILFEHSPTRSGTVAQKFLTGFKGFLHCDGYAGYHGLEGVTLVNCWAHARRKFMEALGHLKTQKHSQAAQAVNYCDQMFQLEAQWKALTPHERQKARETQLRPLMDQFFDWIKGVQALAGSKLGKAIGYVLNLEQGLRNVLLDGHCALSNNLAERSIRPTTVGRKNWNFSSSERGALANGIVYSLVATAKENGLSPWKYFETLFEQLPNLPELSPTTLEDFLPWAEKIQKACQA